MYRTKLSCILCLLVVASCGSHEKGTHQDQPGNEETGIPVSRAQFVQSGMMTGSVQKYVFKDFTRATGVIIAPPADQAVISSYIPGNIMSIPVQDGEKVQKGQVLLKIISTEAVQWQEDFISSASQVRFLEEEYNRQKLLAEQNISSGKLFSRAEADYLEMKGRHEALKVKLQLINLNPDEILKGSITGQVSLTSPINGTVKMRNLTRGMFIQPGEDLMNIFDESKLHLELSVFESGAALIQEGQEILFRLKSSDSINYNAMVYAFSKSIEGEQRKITVYGAIQNLPGYSFLSGTYVEAEIAVKMRNSMGLPSEAVVAQEGQNIIFVMDSLKGDTVYFQRKYIETGQADEDFTEILTDLGNASVLIKGAYYLSN